MKTEEDVQRALGFSQQMLGQARSYGLSEDPELKSWIDALTWVLSESE